MTSLVDVRAYIPPTRVAIRDMADELGIDRIELGVLERFFGLREVCQAPEEDLADMLVVAGSKLPMLQGNENRIRYVVGGRTLPTVAPVGVNPLHDAAARLGLDDAVVWTLTQQACASAMFAIDLAGRLLASDGDSEGLALVFAGEKATSPKSRFLGGMTLMGEGVAACLISAHDEGTTVLSYASRTLGEFHYLTLPEPLASQFGDIYTEVLADVILDALARAQLTLDDVALVLPHNVNRVSWIRLSRRIGFPLERIRLDDVPVTGHCFGADALIGYAAACEANVLRLGDVIVMVTVGLGATFSAMVLRYGKDRR